MRRRFEIFCGDIADCGCDVLVNASNTRLSLGGGVSKRIGELCGGLDYQRALREALAAHVGPERDDPTLLLGEALLTHAGEAAERFRGVVHVASVDYEAAHRGRVSGVAASTSSSAIADGAENALRRCQELIDAEGLDTLSVGFPLLGSSAGKLSPSRSADGLLTGMRRFFKDHLAETDEHSEVDRIVLVVYRDDDVRAVRDQLRRHRVI